MSLDLDSEKDLQFESYLSSNTAQGRYGVAYLRALAAHAEFGFDETSPDEDVRAIDAHVNYSAGNIYVQVKTTYQHDLDMSKESFLYPVKSLWKEKWDQQLLPKYLVVVVVPRELSQRVEHQSNGTLLKDTAAFWVRIDANAFHSPLQIRVPKAQRVTQETFRVWENDLLMCFCSGEVA